MQASTSILKHKVVIAQVCEKCAYLCDNLRELVLLEVGKSLALFSRQDISRDRYEHYQETSPTAEDDQGRQTVWSNYRGKRDFEETRKQDVKYLDLTSISLLDCGN